MPVLNTSNDYTGRKKDLNIAFGINPNRKDRQPLNLQFGQISTFCAGVQKLVQRYMILFLTLAGSQPSFTDFGTDFPKSIYSGNLTSRQDLLHAFNFANFSVLKILLNYQADNPDIPLDEQISTATLSNLDVTGDSLKIDIKIVTNAGDNITFLIPLPLTNS